MVRAVLFPTTLLSDTMMLDRTLAVSCALALFFFFGRRLLLSSLAGVVTLAILCVWRDLSPPFQSLRPRSARPILARQ